MSKRSGSSTAPSSKSKGKSSGLTVSDSIWKQKLFDCNWDPYPLPTEKYNLGDLITGEWKWKRDSETLCSWIIDSYNASLAPEDAVLELSSFDDHRYKSVNEQIIDYVEGVTYYLLDRQSYSPLQDLRPLTSSVTIYPDVGIVYKPFIVLHCEINSSSMSNTVAKLAANLTDELRFERHYDPNITKIVGFAFPKSSSKDYVCKVTVEFRNLTFRVTCRAFELHDPAITFEVNQAIKDHLKLATDLCNKEMKSYTLLPYSETDIELLRKSIAAMGQELEGSLKQVDSQYSVVFHDDMNYYKYSPDVFEQTSVSDFLGQSSDRLVFPRIKLGVKRDGATRLPFFVFPKQMFQLTSLHISQLKSCLFDLASGIKAALEELHDMYEYAHLDVRLANVCFDGKYVKLIDFDRCHEISVKDVASEYNGHYMYEYSGTLDVTKRSVSLLDWKQLGLLIYSILNRSEKDADLTSADFSTMEENTESLIYSLVFNHTWHDEYANNDLCHVKSVHDCFQEPPSTTAHDVHGRHRLHTYYSHEKVTFRFSTTIVS